MRQLAIQIGTGEILLFAAVLLLFFGARRLPELARAIGRSGKELREGFQDEDEHETDADGTT